ncbi:MAG: hypothetical protein E7562_05615 [Ruminococcaceae bacterium]|nr:hypothetical protein [Oscillospiraceae bacterium]
MIGTLLLGVAGIMFIRWAVCNLFGVWGNAPAQNPPQQAISAPMSDTDKEKIKETQNFIKEKFGDNVVDHFREIPKKERVAELTEFAEELAKLYGVELEVDINAEHINSCGFYNFETKTLEFNIKYLMFEKNDENFAFFIKEAINTIVHELRHAVQHKATKESGFWNVDEKTRAKWANNFRNYISPSVDMRGYANQPVEADATTFANAALEGIN